MSRVLKPAVAPPVDTPAAFGVLEAASIKAVYAGTASEHQQRVALEWIIKQAANIGGQSFRTGDSHATAFGEGRRFVGAQIMSLLSLNIDQLKKD